MREGAWEGNSHQKDQIEVTSFESTRQSMILGTYTYISPNTHTHIHTTHM